MKFLHFRIKKLFEKYVHRLHRKTIMYLMYFTMYLFSIYY